MLLTAVASFMPFLPRSLQEPPTPRTHSFLPLLPTQTAALTLFHLQEPPAL